MLAPVRGGGSLETYHTHPGRCTRGRARRHRGCLGAAAGDSDPGAHGDERRAGGTGAVRRREQRARNVRREHHEVRLGRRVDLVAARFQRPYGQRRRRTHPFGRTWLARPGGAGLCGPCQSPLIGTGNITERSSTQSKARPCTSTSTPRRTARENPGQLATTASIVTTLTSRQQVPRPRQRRRANGSFTATVASSGPPERSPGVCGSRG